MAQIFGPVPSRRLGFSLGIDIITPKTCTLDCVYCQLGTTTRKTLQRKQYVQADKILEELRKRLAENNNQKIDYITFSGSGEPTLNLKLGDMIDEIKKITSLPVAVITNGTLLYDKNLWHELAAANLVIPSIDAPDAQIFKRINKPHHVLEFEKVIEGLTEFSHDFPGKIWLEIMLMKEMNDSEEHIEKLKQIIDNLTFDKIQLNTPVRPPAEELAKPASFFALKRAKTILGEKCEIIAEFKAAFEKSEQETYVSNIQEIILAMAKRRPVSLEDISKSLGVNQNEVVKYIQDLQKENVVASKIYGNKRYYYTP